MPSPRHSDAPDRYGFDETRNYLQIALAQLVPAWIARRAVAVSVRTPKDVYDRGEPVDIVVEFKNRLPVPIDVPTPDHRLWGWAVDGVVEATEEPRYSTNTPNKFEFRGGERKRIVQRWNGRMRRTDDALGMDVSELPAPGEHVVSAFLAIGPPGDRPEDSVTITIR